jgi:hypothetical protein
MLTLTPALSLKKERAGVRVSIEQKHQFRDLVGTDALPNLPLHEK